MVDSDNQPTESGMTIERALVVSILGRGRQQARDGAGLHPRGSQCELR
jgi:hypothetical protein